MGKGSQALRLFKGCALLLALGVAAVVMLSVGVAVDHRTTLVLPEPSGALPVGRTIVEWMNDSTASTIAERLSHTLQAWIWYPAQAGGPGDSYVPADLRAPTGGGANVWTYLTHDLDKVRDRAIRDAPLSPQRSSYPVLIMRAGASAPVLNYSTLAEDLASHGYIVVGFDAPYFTGEVVFRGGRVVTRAPANNPEGCVDSDNWARQESCVTPILAAWTTDIALALDHLAAMNRADPQGRFDGRLDLARVGVFGHSLGGAAAAQFCHDDTRCRAGADIDGALHGTVIEEGLRQPFLFLMSDHQGADDPASRRIMAAIDSSYETMPVRTRTRMAIRGANHFTFSDDGALLKSPVVRGVMHVLRVLRIGGRRQLTVTAYCLRTFFDAYLEVGRATPGFDMNAYPELIDLGQQ
jgi:predicted dienelactone hydrolase